jgi:hypothetical protein
MLPRPSGPLYVPLMLHARRRFLASLLSLAVLACGGDATSPNATLTADRVVGNWGLQSWDGRPVPVFTAPWARLNVVVLRIKADGTKSEDFSEEAWNPDANRSAGSMTWTSPGRWRIEGSSIVVEDLNMFDGTTLVATRHLQMNSAGQLVEKFVRQPTQDVHILVYNRL